MPADIRIGISGWTYAPWRGRFYPKGLAHHRELAYAARQFNSIEINGTFYSLQRPDSFQTWYEQTPDDFVFSVKGSRFITHMKKLSEVRLPLANFFASGLLRLGQKLGPILWQFGPNWGLDLKRFEAFFKLLPSDTAQAATLARQHDQRLAGRAHTQATVHCPLRHAVEIRHPSFLVPAFIDLLAQYRIALVFADTAGRWPYAEDLTADFVYIRLHGAEELYVSGYTDSALDWWAERIRLWSAGRRPADGPRIGPASAARSAAREVYVYFDNDAKVKAPFDALALARRISPRPRPHHEDAAFQAPNHSPRRHGSKSATATRP
jgi:uncharacterized protein YecE (DUF72 family)